jgi:iron complex transport system substrate-binding protein
VLRRASLALLGAASLTACGTDTPPAAGVPVDDAGRPVGLTAPAQRIVSLSPATTELLYTLGAGDRVVGRTRWCVDPPGVTGVPNVGDGLDPNVEMIAAREPDLVVLYYSPANAVARERLESLGIATVTVRLDRLDDLARATRLLGVLTGTERVADSLVSALDAELASLRTERPAGGPSVLILAWADPPIVIGSGSFLSEIVVLAGGRNAFGDLPHPSAAVSVEAVAARRPDRLLVTGGESEPPVADRPEWQVVEAVRARRFARVDGTEFSHPSYRLPSAVRQLRAALGLEVR